MYVILLTSMDFCSDTFILQHKSLKQRSFVSSLSLWCIFKKWLPHLLILCIYDNFQVLGFIQDENELILNNQDQNTSITTLFTPTVYSQDRRHLMKTGTNTVLTIWYIISLFALA